MEYLQTWFEQSQWPIWSAFLLGLMTAISPCPMTTNIVAIGYIGKNIQNRFSVIFNGLLYILGRAFSYTALGLLFYLGASQFHIAGFLQQWGEKVMGPLLIIIGLFMIGAIKINFSLSSNFTSGTENLKKNSIWRYFLLGIIFALAFCPYSGVLYFGMLIPMTISQTQGLFLPLFYAIGTSIPVIVFAVIIAYSISSVNQLFTDLKKIEFWFRKIVAALFIGAGAYLSYLTWIN